MSNNFALGRVDVSCLNFGILSLIPKVKCVDLIKQFRLTALISSIFKFIVKAYVNLLCRLPIGPDNLGRVNWIDAIAVFAYMKNVITTFNFIKTLLQLCVHLIDVIIPTYIAYTN
jgi:hypothetical protein